MNKQNIALLQISFFLILVFSCSSTPLPTNASADVPEDFFGMNHAGGADAEKGEYALLEEMGIIFLRNDLTWRLIEKERGVFDYSEFDTYINTAKSEGRNILAVLSFQTPWLYPEGENRRYISPENLPLFLNYVERTVLRYKDSVDAWEIWNEPNLPRFWNGPRDDFFELSKATALKIREIHPEAYIIGGAFSLAPRGFILDMNKAGAFENLDGISFHPYGTSPRMVIKVYDKLLNILSEINFSGDVWITETGYPTGGSFPMRVSLEELPSHVIKTITGSTARGARGMMWYHMFDWNNINEVPYNFDSNRFYGLAYPDYSKKAGGWAYQLCAQYLPGSHYTNEYPQRENIPSRIVSFCFLGGLSGSNTLILWNDRKEAEKINLFLSDTALLHNISSGESHSIPGETVLDVGNEPLFITWQGQGIPRLSR